MKIRRLINSRLLLILLIGLGLQSCKKDEVATRQVEDNFAKTNTAALTIQAGGLYIGTVYKTPTIGSMTRIATGSDGTMYVSSYPADQIFKITTDSLVSVLAKNINSPAGLKVAKNGNVYAALFFDNKIIRITPSGIVDTLRLNLTLNHPTDVAIADDLTLYIADGFHKRILKVSPTGVATVLAGKMGSTDGAIDGTGTAARFNYPTSLKLGADGYLWVVDGDKQGGSGLSLRRVSTKGIVKTVLSTVGSGLQISEIQPAKVDENFNTTAYGNVFVLYNRNKITLFDTQRNLEIPITINQTSGYKDGPIATALLQGPAALSLRNNILYIADGTGNAIRKIYKK